MSESTHEAGDKTRSIGRRNFMKLGLLSAASLALHAYNVGENIELNVQKIEDVPDLDKEITLGNLHLTPIVTEHDKNTWVESGEKVLSQILKFDLIIPEYFPPEYAHLRETVGLSTFKDSNALFDEITPYLLDNKKDVWVLDPAYSEAAILFRPVANAGRIAEAIVLTSAISEVAPALNSIADNSVKVNSNKNAIKVAAKIGYIGAASGLAATQEISPIETKFRRAMVAESISLLSRRVDINTKAAIIYPEAHWKGIKHYLDNPEERRNTLKEYSTIKQIPVYEPMFETRHYKGENGQWTKLNGFSVDVKPK